MIGGPLLALGLVVLIGVRSAILLAIIPGLLAALAIIYAIRATPAPTARPPPAAPLALPPAPPRLAGSDAHRRGCFRAGKPRGDADDPPRHRPAATWPLAHRRSQFALILYAACNLAATLVSIPAGLAGDRRGMLLILAAGAGCFVVADLGFATSGDSLVVLGGCFILAGVGIGCAETAQTAETAAVAQLAPEQLRGSAFGLLATVQAIGTWPPAQSPEFSGPPYHRPPRSCT